jgi:small subunit ribosomal protein S17
MENTVKRGIKTLTGVVVSDVMDKTAVVEVERKSKHPLYKKTIRTHKKYMAHDANNECGKGDIVEILACRPMSARKRYRVFKVVKKAV